VNRDGASAGPVVEVDQDDLLPGSEHELTADDGHALRWSDQRGFQVRVGVGVVVEPVVLVVAARRHKRFQQRRHVGNCAGLVFDRRHGDGSPGREHGAHATIDAGRTHNAVDPFGDVDDRAITGRLHPQHTTVDSH
jgi:hypothetical protein